MKPYFRAICLTLIVAIPVVAQAQDLFSNTSSQQDPIIKTLPGKSIPKGSSARGVTPEERIRNDHATFSVRVSVCLLDDQGKFVEDRSNYAFTEGECMGVRVKSSRAGYLYLLYKQADGSAKCLFPNKFDQNNHIPAGEICTVPDSRYDFNMRVTPPFGEETLIALVSEKPLSADAFDNKSLTTSVVTDVDLDTVIAKGVEPQLRQKPGKWAEHSINVTSRSKSAGAGATPMAQKKRLGLFVGISKYKDERIPALSICHTDAEFMAEVMKQYCRLDQTGVLIDSQATRAAIEQAFKELKQVSKPGDEIFIYWSGHGASCADTDGDRKSVV